MLSLFCRFVALALVLLTARKIQFVSAQEPCGASTDTAAFYLTLKWKDLAPDGFQRLKT